MSEDHAPEVNLSDSDHIECPYKMYERIHKTRGVARDPNVGTLVVGYDALAAMARDTEVYSSSITEDGQGPRARREARREAARPRRRHVRHHLRDGRP